MKMRSDFLFCDDSYREGMQSYLENSNECCTKLLQNLEKSPEGLGWFDWPQKKGFELLKNIEKEIQTSIKEYYDCVVVVGIGGSYLGTLAIYEILSSIKESAKKTLPIHFLGHNLSERYIASVIEKIDCCHPLVIVVSKSGKTVETCVSFSLIEEYLIHRFGKKEAISRTVLITDSDKGFFRELATKDNYLSFVVPDNIGGRYSVLTAVGMVPLVAAGFSVELLMQGASDVFSDLRTSKSLYLNLVNEYVAFRKKSWDDGKKIEVLAYNDPCLFSFSEWWKQLFAESEGKDKKGLFPTQMIYSTALHSLGQYVQEGPPVVAETFLVFEDFNYCAYGNIEKRIRVPSSSLAPLIKYCSGHYIDDINKKVLEAAYKAHFESGVPCFRLKVPKLNSYYLGSLFAFFQVSCAVSALTLDVNPFDQPGVEVYKENLSQSLQADRA